jgi:hypothetical protein
MSASPSSVVTWKWGAFAAAAMVLLSLIPQIHLWIVRGRDWNGAYATLQGDEFLYSAYINALIDGRPRRNDPFAGKDSMAQSPLPESTFSIQFIPAYVLSFLARTFRISASSIFIALMAAAGLLASWSVFWLLASVTGDRRLAAAGVFVALCLGELAGDQGIVGVLLLNHKLSVFMPFLRRYQPALPLPLFFLFCALVWRALSLGNKWRARLHSTLAGLTLAGLVFSYLYLWTAAAAWLMCVSLLWTGFHWRGERRRSLEVFAITASLMLFAMVPYVYLVAGRSKSLDDAQILVLTHRLDLFHTPELLGALVLFALIISARLGRIKLSEPRAIFTASFAFLPFVLFNQQLLTGRSMQPFHFDLFVANYAVLISLIILVTLLWRPIPNRALLWIAVLCFSWGLVEVGLLARARTAPDVVDDQTVPVLRRLKELAKVDGTLAGLRNQGSAPAVLFSRHVDVMRLLPTWTSQGTLLGAGAQDFGTATRKERKELLYQQLYYSEVDGARFREFLNQRTEDTYMNFFAPSVIFGDERFIPALSLHPNPIQQNEIEEEVRAYQAYTDSFSRENLLHRPLTYVVTRAEDKPDLLSHIDLWYERDAGERVGAYILYRLQLRK